MDAVPDNALLRALVAVAHPVRLDLLRALQQPKALSEIEVRQRPGPAGGRSRPLARQTIKQHLERLVDVGLVEQHPAKRPFGATTEYGVNHQRLFALSETFRDLASLYPLREVNLPTMQHGAVGGAQVTGPALVLVRGLHEGRVFPLQPGPGRRQWVIGRRRTAAVCLEFDPFVSSENAQIAWADGRHRVADLQSRNGTWLNFRPLPAGEAVPLRTGDLVGVGRSLLLYRDPA